MQWNSRGSDDGIHRADRRIPLSPARCGAGCCLRRAQCCLGTCSTSCASAVWWCTTSSRFGIHGCRITRRWETTSWARVCSSAQRCCCSQSCCAGVRDAILALPSAALHRSQSPARSSATASLATTLRGVRDAHRARQRELCTGDDAEPRARPAAQNRQTGVFPARVGVYRLAARMERGAETGAVIFHWAEYTQAGGGPDGIDRRIAGRSARMTH